MKIHILFDFVKGPYGGGNQFLKALNNELKELTFYENDPEKADVILFNSHHNLKDTIKLKKKYSKKIFVQRVDGPMAYRGIEGIKLDKKIFLINSIIADGTVFQSQWSQKIGKNIWTSLLAQLMEQLPKDFMITWKIYNNINLRI